MEMRIDFLKWLSVKLYLISLGMYATIALVMLLPGVFSTYLNVPQVWTSFGVFFVISFLRAAYESLVIYESPVKSLSLHKMLILTFVTSSTISIISMYLTSKLGYFSIPVALIISMIVVGKLKAALWPSHERHGFFAELPAKLELISTGRYGFYAILVGITYFAYAKHNLSFVYSFAAAFFIGMMFEELYNFTKLYEQKITVRSLSAMIFWSAVCAVASTFIVMVMIKGFGYDGKPATIVSVILLKLIQPFGMRKFF